MHDDELLKVKIEEILDKYDSMPITGPTTTSLVEEIALEIASHMETGDGPQVIARFMDRVDLRKWE
jgi:hypothetical protein